ncbi:hypothetical protein ACJMK2_020709 [Sinanodonta woodiana]|uniref:Ras-associating domain-containing protein n=1 Tax=Sinanodonta woodiana TaxID=1069815 RepID=A0ABD3U001_SINWO
MADIKKAKLYEVHIFLNAKDHVIKNVTKRSTCDDIIKSLHRHRNTDKENGPMYALYESMHGVDRELSGKTKIHKLLKAWGSNKDNAQLVLRRKSDIDTKFGVSAPDQVRHRRQDKYCCNRKRDSADGNDNIRRLSRIVHLQRQRMRSIMKSHSSEVPPQEATTCRINKLNPSRAMFSNDLLMHRHRRREHQERKKRILSPKMPDPVHRTPESEKTNFVITAPEFTAVKFANSKPLKVKQTNKKKMSTPSFIGIRPPCIGQVHTEGFGHNHSRIMGDGEYSYYIEEAYGSKETKDNYRFFLDRHFRSINVLGQRHVCPRDCSALDIGFLEDTVQSYVNQIENGISDSDKDCMHQSKHIYKFFEKSLNTEIPATDGAKNYMTNSKQVQQQLVDNTLANDQLGMAKSESRSSHALTCGSIHGSMQLVDYSFSDNETVTKC